MVAADLDSSPRELEDWVGSGLPEVEIWASLEVDELALVLMLVEVVLAMLLVVDLVEASDWVVGAERLDLRLVEAALVLSGWLA